MVTYLKTICCNIICFVILKTRQLIYSKKGKIFFISVIILDILQTFNSKMQKLIIISFYDI